jgi:hypothetical protein
MLFISSSYLVSFIIINLMLNLTVSVLAGIPTDVTKTLTEVSAVPNTETA